MTGNEYQMYATRTNDGDSTLRLKVAIDEADRYKFPDVGDIVNGCLGLSGEVGEFNDMIKKWIFHQKPLDHSHAKKEIGDILWYIAMICHGFKWDMDNIMQINIDKLRARYPFGFDIDRANNRGESDV